ncbi:MAG: leucine-rich repeat protein [Lachnospiraceae bacterium]|nr:leucine-rich repeat protein [Lachnospiraceae bacterium]
MQNKFDIENNILRSYTGSDQEVIVPEGITVIGDGAFKGNAGLVKVTLPSTVTKIGAHAFKGCRLLRKINFPVGITEIGEYAFHRCHCIEEMFFPDSLTKVGSYAFLYCDGVRKVVLKGVKHLPRAAFSHNISLLEIDLSKELDYSNFSDEVFEGCIRLRRITLSDDIYEVDNLVSAMDSDSDYPEIIKAIAKSVYHSLQIEDGELKSFNINLKSVSIPDGITSIGRSCFFDKKGIEDITLPDSVREIKANAFLNCVGLDEITVPNADIKLDDKAFRGCCNLKKVNLAGKTYSLENESDNEFVNRIRDQVYGDFYISGRILVRYTGDEEHVKIPSGVEIIGERCFFANERVKAVTCPAGFTEIREQAFSGCVTLQNVNLPDTLKVIEREAFAECKKLLKINIPVSLEYIGEYAFRRCFVLMPFEPWPAEAAISPYAFYKAGNFENIIPEKSENVKLDKGHDDNNDEVIPDYAFTNNCDIKNLMLSGIRKIGKYAYASCPDLETVTIDAPECIIGRDAFSSCNKLKKAVLNVNSLETGVFSYCRNLEEVRIKGVSILPENCFTGCYSLNHIDHEGISCLDSKCFDECVSLGSFDFRGIGMIGEKAFERCDYLKSVDVSGVMCGFHAFADCASLKTVILDKETVLKSGVFSGCTQINEIIYESVKYEFSRFFDGLNHAGNKYPAPVKELISSIYSCFEIKERKKISGYIGDSACVSIPRDIGEIGQDVFRDHSRIKEINIPESVNKFGSHAFFGTGWLESQRKLSDMVIVNGILIDGAECRGRVTIPENIKRLSSWCFAGNIDITELEIRSEKTGIESLALRNCINLKKIILSDKKEYVLSDVSDLKNVGYPELVQRIFSECINCFKLDEMGRLTESTGNIKKLTFPGGIRSVGDGVYKDCHLLDEIKLSDETEYIGKSSFENSKWLKTVSNAKNIKTIGAMAFSGCQCLESIDISDKLSEIGKRCFEHCCSLKEFSFSGNIKCIPERAFFRCKSLQEIYIPESVTDIGSECFAFCDSLKKVYVPEYTNISDNAFAFCDNVNLIRYSAKESGGQ